MRRYPPPTVHPPRGSLPVLLSVPHSGRDYDSAVLTNAAQGRRALETLEDPLVDRLVLAGDRRAASVRSSSWCRGR